MDLLRRILRVVAVDVDLLRRRRELRLLMIGQGVSLLGSAVTLVAIPVQMYDETGSTVAVGLVGATQFVAIVALALLGGALADAFDRRRLMIGAELGSLAVTIALCANALLAQPQVWLLYGASALLAGLMAILRPPLDALVPRLVERRELAAASALYGAVRNAAGLGGPALAGVMIAVAGFPATYGVDGLTFLVSLAALWRLRTPPPAPDAEPPSWRGIVEGLRFARSKPVLIGTYLIDINAMFFAMPEALFPAYAQRHGGAAVAGFLYAAPAAGALALSLASGWTRHVIRHGRAVVVAAAGWGAAIVVFGLAGPLWLAIAALVVAGASDAVSAIFRGTIWNEVVPDRMRGRLAGMEVISFTAGPTLGNVEAGFAAALVGLRGSIVLGGVICVGGSVALAAALPELWRYESEAMKAPALAAG
ncbi:MAG TPA: MFS transporter [Solirubrobacteraceae bacterium]|nr:MFS transporter [Solirubrobacteraceae bacterium]